MTYKIKLIFVLGILSLLLTACGAQVSTETSFAKDGSGQRVIYLKIAMKDEGKIKGGFASLDRILEESAPACLDVSSHEDLDAELMIYELRYDFTNIQEYKDKTEEITGKDTNIKWELDGGAFQGAVSYSETTSTEDLIQWALEALRNESLSGAMISDYYEVESNTVLYNGDTVWTGLSNPSFKVDLTPKVEDVSVYTTYSEDGGVRKQINIGFSYEDYRSMDTEAGLEYLKEFSRDFKVNSSCNGFSVILDNQEALQDFFEKASEPIELEPAKTQLELPDGVTSYYFENVNGETIFSNKVFIKEVYNFNKLLEGFVLATDKIHDYVSVPKRENYTTELIHHTYRLESTDAYQYIGDYDIQDTFYMYFEGGTSAEVSSASVNFTIDESLRGCQTVTLVLLKNGMKFTSSQVMESYVELGEKVQYQEDDKTATITFTKELSYQKEGEENDIVKLDTMQFYRLKYQFHLDFNMQKYYYNDSMKVEYTVSIPDTFKVQSFSFGNDVLNTKSIKDRTDNEKWTYVTELTRNNQFIIDMVFSQANMFFYGVLCMLVLLVIGIGLSIYFFVKGKREHK